MKHCVIDQTTGLCVNIIELESADQYQTTDPALTLAPDCSGEIGWTWDGTAWQELVPIYTDEQWAAKIRRGRDRLLHRHIDRINYIRWSSMSQAEQDAWTVYRQALLEIPQQPGFPNDITWPQPPINGN